MRRIVFICSLFLSTFVFSQNTNWDKLLPSLTEKQQFDTLMAMINHNRFDNPQMALHYARLMFKQSSEFKHDSTKIIAYCRVARVYRDMGQVDSAYYLIDLCKPLLSTSEGYGSVCEYYSTLGSSLRFSVKIKESIDAYLAGLKIAEKHNDDLWIAQFNNNVASMYFKLKELDKALACYNKALEIRKKMGNEFQVAVLNDNIGLVYFAKGNYDLALEKHLGAYAVFSKTDNLNVRASNMVFIGNVFSMKNLFAEAEKYFNMANDINRQTKNLQNYVHTSSNLADLKFREKKYAESERIYKHILTIIDSGKIDYDRMDIYNALSACYMFLLRPDSAYKYSLLYEQVRDSVFSYNLSEQIADMQTKYETEKKESQILLLEKDKKNQSLIIYSIIVGIVLLTFIFILVLRSNIQRKKTNSILAEQNQIILQKNRDITDSINYAKRIQEAMLPGKQLLEKKIPEHFIFYQPKDIVSGDFYWFTQKDNYFFMAVADCTGHGVPGALMSMIGISFLNQIVNEQNILSPNEILNELHKKVVNALNDDAQHRESKDGMDIALIRIEKNKIHFAGAVRPLYYFINGELHIVKGDRYSIAGVKDFETSFTNNEVSLNTPASIYMFTDGYADQFNGNTGKKYLIKRFQEKLKNIQSESLLTQKKIMAEEVNNWRDGAEQVDDILVVGVKINA